MRAQRRRPPRKAADFDARPQIDALGAYIQANGGGPVVREPTARSRESLSGDDVARGGELFRLNCASCHNFTGRAARCRPASTPRPGPGHRAQIYTAMLTGPQNMPKFSDRQLSPEEKKDIIAYVKYAAETTQPGRLRPRRLRTGHRGHGRSAIVGMVAAIWIGVGDCGCGATSHEQQPDGDADDAGRPSRAGGRCPATSWLALGGRARRRRDRPQGAALARRGHQGREARRARGGAVVAARRRCSAWRCCWCFLFWPWEYEPPDDAGTLLVHARTRRCIGAHLRAVDPGHRHRRGAATRRSSSPKRSPSRTATTAPPPEIERKTDRGQPDDALRRLDASSAAS